MPVPRFICPAPLNNNCSRYSIIGIGIGVAAALASRSLIYCALGVWLRSSSSLVAW